MPANNNVAVVSTSTSSIDFVSNIEDYPISVLRLRLVIDGEKFVDGVTMRADTMMQRLYKDPSIKPSTTYPPEEEILSTLSTLKAKGHPNILVMTASRTVSKSFDIVSKLAKEIEGVNIVVYDTDFFAMPEGLMALKAAQMAKQNASIEQILKVLDRMKYDIELLCCINNMNYLYGHDYVGLNQFMATKIFQIKPILGFKNGRFYVVDKVRKFDHAIQRLAEITTEKMKNPNIQPIGLMLGNVEAYSKFINLLPEQPKLEVPLSPVVAAHMGVDAVAIGFCGKLEKYG